MKRRIALMILWPKGDDMTTMIAKRAVRVSSIRIFPILPILLGFEVNQDLRSIRIRGEIGRKIRI